MWVLRLRLCLTTLPHVGHPPEVCWQFPICREGSPRCVFRAGFLLGMTRVGMLCSLGPLSESDMMLVSDGLEVAPLRSSLPQRVLGAAPLCPV